MEQRTTNFDDKKLYHQWSEQSDGSICARKEPGDLWKLLYGDGNSKAAKFANQQNKFWKPWMKDALRRAGERHDDEDSTFSRRIKKP